MQRLERILFCLAVPIVFVGLLYLADWAVLKIRALHGTAYRTVIVHQLLATPLKGNKQEYDLMGTIPKRCSRSIFPQQGNPPCWWLIRHRSQWE